MPLSLFTQFHARIDYRVQQIAQQRAYEHARSAQRRLYPHGARKGAFRAQRYLQACVPQYDAVLACCGFDAERNGDYKLQNSGNKGDPEGNTHVVHDHLSDGFLIFE